MGNSPAPWRLTPGMSDIDAQVWDARDFVLVANVNGNATPGDMLAIAAAPELRDALAWALDVIRSEFEGRDGRVKISGYDEARALLSRLDATVTP